MNLRDILQEYREERAPIVACVHTLDRQVALLQDRLGRFDAADLTRPVLQQFIDERTVTVCLQTVKREFITLRAALRLAWRNERIKRVPWIPSLPAGQPRQRILTTEEIQRLRSAVAGHDGMALFVDVALSTGARLGAIAELTWHRVDFARRVIDFRAPHPRAARRKCRAVVPMSDSLYFNLRKAYERRRGNSVFGVTAGTIGRNFRRYADRAGLTDVTPHVLRHVVATELLRQVPLVHVSRMLGHKSVAITEQVYGHLMVEDLIPAAQSLGKWLLPSQQEKARIAHA